MNKEFLAVLLLLGALVIGFVAYFSPNFIHESETTTVVQPELQRRVVGAHIADRNEEASKLSPSTCTEIAEPGYLEALAQRYPDISYDELCARVTELWPQAQAIIDAESQDGGDMGEYFVPVDRYSDYKSYDTTTLAELAVTDAVAAHTLAHRQRYIDRDASRAWYARAAVLSGKPGPLVDALMYQKSIVYSKDPETNERSYDSVDDIVHSAVFATVAMRMGYPEDLRSQYMNHLAISGMVEFESVVEIRSDKLLSAIQNKNSDFDPIGERK